jgi:hypothetical protein
MAILKERSRKKSQKNGVVSVSTGKKMRKTRGKHTY